MLLPILCFSLFFASHWEQERNEINHDCHIDRIIIMISVFFFSFCLSVFSSRILFKVIPFTHRSLSLSWCYYCCSPHWFSIKISHLRFWLLHQILNLSSVTFLTLICFLYIVAYFLFCFFFFISFRSRYGADFKIWLYKSKPDAQM